MNERPDQKRDEKYERSTPQWTAFIVSSLVVLIVLGLVIYDIFIVGLDPPVIEIVPMFDEVRYENDRYYLPVALINSGASTAEDVTVDLSLQPLDGEPEDAGFTIRFLAPGEREVGVVIFSQDPMDGSLFYSISFVRPN